MNFNRNNNIPNNPFAPMGNNNNNFLHNSFNPMGNNGNNFVNQLTPKTMGNPPSNNMSKELKKEIEIEDNIRDYLKCYICLTKVIKPKMCKFRKRICCERCIIDGWKLIIFVEYANIS